MDFFERQDQARHNTKLLTVYFLAGVAALIVAVYLAVALVFSGVSFKQRPYRDRYYGYEAQVQQTSLWNPQLFLGVAVVTLAVIGIGSAFKTMELSKGGSVVATNLGGRLINPHTTDLDERKLLNVVEEMAIAAGIPVPQVYVLPQEQGINAFAAGHSTSDAVVAVTEGTMKLLTRDELQGVVGHEFSHILNGDMRLNLRLMGIIFGILCLTVVGRILLRTRGRKNPLPLLGLALLLIGWIGVLFGRLIQAAVSRQREFLADASSVQFTRNPAGLAGALKKIGGLVYGSKLEAADAAEASHMFFGNGVGESFLHLMDTHPPLEQRIKAIDPSFDGTFPPVSIPQLEAPPQIARAPRREPIPFPFPGTSRPQAALAGLAGGSPVIAAQAVMPDLGTPTTAHVQYAEGLRSSIPASLQSAVREPMGASALIYALLLSDSDGTRTKQLADLANATSDAMVHETLRLWPEVRTLPEGAKLPLVSLALPGLRTLSPAQFQQFRGAVQKLVETDGEIDLFEYVVQKIVLRHLEPYFFKARKPVTQFYSLKPLAPDCAILLSALAYVGQTEPEKVQFAFQQGAQTLSYAAQNELHLATVEQCDLAQVDAALDRLTQAVPQIKKNVINACAQTVAADGAIQVAEAELLRAIADTLDCPIPPFIQLQ